MPQAQSLIGEAVSHYRVLEKLGGGMGISTKRKTPTHLQLGRSYAMQGDTRKARAAYNDFLTLSKDADPDIPILKQAKVEYANLQ
jgi:hypothetical protein